MGNFDLLMQGFGTSFSVANVLLAIAGGFMGLLVGAMPGIGAVTGVALLLPLTFKMDPTSQSSCLPEFTMETCTVVPTAPSCSIYQAIRLQL